MSLSVKQAVIKINNNFDICVTDLSFGELHYGPQLWHHLVPYMDKGDLTYRETHEKRQRGEKKVDC